MYDLCREQLQRHSLRHHHHCLPCRHHDNRKFACIVPLAVVRVPTACFFPDRILFNAAILPTYTTHDLPSTVPRILSFTYAAVLLYRRRAFTAYKRALPLPGGATVDG